MTAIEPTPPEAPVTKISPSSGDIPPIIEKQSQLTFLKRNWGQKKASFQLKTSKFSESTEPLYLKENNLIASFFKLC